MTTELCLHHLGKGVKVDHWYCLYTWPKLPLELHLATRVSWLNLTQNHSLWVSHQKLESKLPNQCHLEKSANHPLPWNARPLPWWSLQSVKDRCCLTCISTRSSECYLTFFSMLTRRCHAWLSMNPLSLLKLLQCKQILMASFNSL
jgi:hypothetical protein